MEWAKSPVVAGSMLCAACLVVATAVPAAPPVAEQPTKAVHAGVNLAVDFSAIDAFSAIPQYQTLVNGSSTPAEISTALTALASLSGIPAFVNFANGGGLAALVPYAALSGLNRTRPGISPASTPSVRSALRAWVTWPRSVRYRSSSDRMACSPVGVSTRSAVMPH